MGQKKLNERIGQAWERAWNHGDVDALDDVLAPDYLRSSLVDLRTLDRDGMKSLILTVREAFPDLKTTISKSITAEESIAILWSSVGTHLGKYCDVPPTGKSIVTAGASFFRARRGLIIEEIETWDSRVILSTLGIHSLRSANGAQEGI